MRLLGPPEYAKTAWLRGSCVPGMPEQRTWCRPRCRPQNSVNSAGSRFAPSALQRLLTWPRGSPSSARARGSSRRPRGGGGSLPKRRLSSNCRPSGGPRASSPSAATRRRLRASTGSSSPFTTRANAASWRICSGVLRASSPLNAPLALAEHLSGRRGVERAAEALIRWARRG
jgi:hypothetical protein